MDWTVSFNPLEMQRAVRAGEVQTTVRRMTLRQGALANSHFVAIPFDADHVDAAMVVANFLISPEAQARKGDVAWWGDPSVLDPERLAVVAGPLPPDRPAAADLANEPAVADLDASWMTTLEHEWQRRYGAP